MALNYEQVKKKYFELVETQQQNIELLKNLLCTRQEIEEKIRQITLNPSQARNFKVKIGDGKNKLFMKRNPHAYPPTTVPTQKYLEVLSVEDAFDVLLETHLACHHGDAQTTYDKLILTHSLPVFCAKWIVESCNVCHSLDAESQKSETKSDGMVLNKLSGRGLWRLNIIRDQSLVENSRKCFLLILKEDTTNFVILRPIFETSEELGLDLMKIFSEFGYPEKVCVPNMLTFYKTIFQMVYLINPVMKVRVEEVSHLSHVFEKDKKEVLDEIKNWTEMMQDAYWEHSCHIVQYKLNTTKKQFTRLYGEPDDKEFVGIPFNEFFNYPFRARMAWISPALKIMSEPKSLNPEE